MKNPFAVRNMPFIASLAAIEIVLQIIGNYIALGPVSINLSLVPIGIGAMLFGPWVGLFLGLINSLFVLLSPFTAAFYNVSVVGTFVTCIVKSSVAGFGGGLIYMLLKRHNKFVASIVTLVSLPIINTGLFVVGCLIFFVPLLETASAGYTNIYEYLFIVMCGWNFIFEISTSVILSYPIYRLVNLYDTKFRIE